MGHGPKHVYNTLGYNCNTIVFTENTKFVDSVEQKITTNPKLGQNRKSTSTEEADL